MQAQDTLKKVGKTYQKNQNVGDLGIKQVMPTM